MARRQPPPPPPPRRTTATTPTSRIYVDRRNHWSPIEQENVTFDRGTLFNGPYRPKERLMDRDRVTQLVTQDDDDNFDDFGDHVSDGLRSPLRGSSMYNQRLNEYQLHDNYSGQHEAYQGGERGDQSLVNMLQQQQAMLQKLISQQESMNEKQKAMDQRIHSIEEKMAQSSSTSVDSSPGSSEKRARARVTRDLTVSLLVHTLGNHNTIPFAPSMSFP